MRRGGVSSLSLLFFICMFSGCGGTSSLPVPLLEPDYRISPSARFHFRPPAGWIDVSTDMSSNFRHVSLVSPDDQSAIEVVEIVVSEDLHEEIERDGCEAVARALLLLESEGGSAIISEEITRDQIDQRDSWLSALSLPDSSVHRTAVFCDGTDCFEVRMVLRTAEDPDKAGKTLHAFLEALRW